MKERNFAGIDLNLLVTFVVLMRERSTTMAGRSLALSQSAVSHSLRKLRDMFDDELFVRAGNKLVPTPRAVALHDDLLPLLGAIESKLTERESFRPATSARIFRLGLPSALDVCVTPFLLSELSARAPNVNLVVRSANVYSGPRMLDDDEVDLAVSYFSEIGPAHHRRPLGSHNYGCIFDRARLGIDSPISLDQYLAAKHLLTSFSGDRSGVADKVLAEQGHARRILVATEEFSTIPFYLLSSDTIATLPVYAAKAYAQKTGLTYSPVPFSMPDFEISMIWHVRLDKDPGHRWLRALVAESVRVL
jgi:LysR family transcriptional regulator, mexEF-oprN operon transcriptional activator